MSPNEAGKPSVDLLLTPLPPIDVIIKASNQSLQALEELLPSKRRATQCVRTMALVVQKQNEKIKELETLVKEQQIISDEVMEFGCGDLIDGKHYKIAKERKEAMLKLIRKQQLLDIKQETNRFVKEITEKRRESAALVNTRNVRSF